MSRWNPQPAIERTLPRLEIGDCWLWTGALVPDGYGQVRGDDGRMVSVHRLVYEYLVGPIPSGLQLDHLCRVRRCCNPDHLEPVTNRENRLRGQPDSCKYGHLFDGRCGRQRTCSVCKRRRWQERRDRLAVAS